MVGNATQIFNFGRNEDGITLYIGFKARVHEEIPLQNIVRGKVIKQTTQTNPSLQILNPPCPLTSQAVFIVV